MHIGQVLLSDGSNGLGLRVSVFVSGCTNHCEGCFQPQTWDFRYGKLYDNTIEQLIMDELSKDYHQGLTILGGEPFELENQKEVANLIKRVKSELPEKDIWIYTGFLYDIDLQPGGKRHTNVTDYILDSIDVLVDGPFIKSLRNLCLSFRGSENQRVIDMKKTRKTGEIVLLSV